MKKGGGGIHIHLTNRLAYTLIALFLLIAAGIGVYALAPGVIPNPGHNINEMSVPSGCVAGQVLSYNGNALVCTNQSSASLPTGTIAGAYIIQYVWGPGQNYSGFDADAAINVNGAGLGFIATRCSTNFGLASNCVCPVGYSASFIPGGNGVLQGEFTGSASCNGQASCVVTNYAVFCMKQ